MREVGSGGREFRMELVVRVKILKLVGFFGRSGVSKGERGV